MTTSSPVTKGACTPSSTARKKMKTLDCYFTPSHVRTDAAKLATSASHLPLPQSAIDACDTTAVSDDAGSNAAADQENAGLDALNVDQLTNGKRKACGTPRQLVNVDPVTASSVSPTVQTPSKRVKAAESSTRTPAPLKQPVKKSVFKNGRLTFPEKPLAIHSRPECVVELAAFYSSSQSLTEPATEFPADKLSLLAKLIEESELPLDALVATTHVKLCPAGMDYTDNEYYSVEVVKKAVETVAARVNYGLDEETYGAKTSLWRWEVQDINLLPESLRASLNERREKRAALRDSIQEQIADLDEATVKATLLQTNGKKRGRPANVDLATTTPNATEQKQKAKIELESARKLKEEARKKEREVIEAEKQLKRDKREQERLAKLEKDEAKRAKKEEDERKALLAQPRIKGFFHTVKKGDDTGKVVPISDFEATFSAFYLKPHTKLAPTLIRVDVNDGGESLAPSPLERYQNGKRAKLCAGGKHGSIGAELALQLKRPVVVKFLQFHENYRPAFFGGRINSENGAANGRRPWNKVPGLILDYEVDSDDEWEEEEEGDECLSDEDDEEDEMSVNGADEDEDDPWIVPHGYLSDDEGMDDDCHTAKSTVKVDDIKARKFEVLVPVIVGPVYSEDSSELMPVVLEGLLIRPLFGGEPWSYPHSFIEEIDVSEPSTAVAAGSPSVKTARKTKLTEEMSAELSQMTLGTTKGVDKIVDEFRQRFGDAVSKYQVSATIRDLFVKEKATGEKLLSWHARPKVTPPADAPAVQDSLT